MKREFLWYFTILECFQKQPLRGVPWKRCSENMHQIYSRTPTRKCNFNKVACWSLLFIKLQASNFIEIALRHGCSAVNLLHIFRTPFPRNTSEWLLLYFSTPSVLQLNFNSFWVSGVFDCSRATFTCSNSIIETSEQCMICSKFKIN